jgi:hypothetical protein
LPYFTAAIVAATPLGAVAGKVARAAGHRKG